MEIRGVARIDHKTKNLVKRLRPTDVAVIDHQDLDQVSAEGLARARVRAVVNAAASISGRYPNLGPQVLVEAGIPLLDNAGPEVMQLKEGSSVEIRGGSLWQDGRLVARGVLLDRAMVAGLMAKTRENLQAELESFVQNTLDYAKREKDLILGGIEPPRTRTRLDGRHVLVVVRGSNFREDLATLRSYINEVKPVLIGVDGGADALLEAGYKPDILIGDMDSVSDRALLSGAEIIVHAYPDGRAPGAARVEALGIAAQAFPAPGTSEDIAMLLAYERGADLIVAVGAHSNMIDFLEKGRRGMASTFLVRLKVGSILVDARGVSRLYRAGIRSRYLLLLIFAALLPLVALVFVAKSPPLILKTLWIRLKLLFGI
ncbi:MAG: putative cytokinetic ring protein SteA [Patescibacteria group bacterium]